MRYEGKIKGHFRDRFTWLFMVNPVMPPIYDICVIFDSSEQGCSISSALAMGILQSCTNPSIWSHSAAVCSCDCLGKRKLVLILVNPFASGTGIFGNNHVNTLTSYCVARSSVDMKLNILWTDICVIKVLKHDRKWNIFLYFLKRSAQIGSYIDLRKDKAR